MLYDWLMAHGEDVLTGDSFFHLAAFGEALPGPQPLRRRPGGLPDRPDRRRLRLPVRDPRQLPGRQPARRRRLPAGLADLRAVRGPALAADRRRLREVRRSTTPAAAAAWPRSSSPACRSTARTPSASRGTARPRSAGDRDDPGRQPGPLQGQPDPQPAGDAQAADPSAVRPPVSDCAESPLAGLRARAAARSWHVKLENPWKQNPWFESVAVAQRARAASGCPQPVYGALVAGSERGQTHRRQPGGVRRARAGAARRRPAAPSGRWRRTVLGQEISLPVLISPTGVQAVHPDGEVAVARAAAARGTVMGLSNFASKSVEEVVATGATHVLPDVLDRRPRRDGPADGARPRRPARWA